MGLGGGRGGGNKGKLTSPNNNNTNNANNNTNSLVNHPIFLCLSCLLGFCLVVTIVLIPIPEEQLQSNNNNNNSNQQHGYLKDLLAVGRSKILFQHQEKQYHFQLAHEEAQQQAAENAMNFHHENVVPVVVQQQHEQEQQHPEQEQRRDQQQQQQQQQAIAAAAVAVAVLDTSQQPIIPYLPPFSPVPNAEQLKYETLHEKKPTVAGIVAILQDFLNALHASNKENAAKKADLEDMIQSYIDLALKYISPLEEAYRGKPIFPTRSDDSIFISLAAFREHLLAQTLRSAFEQAEYPEKLYIGVIVQNCFGYDGYQCRTGMQVYGKDEKTGKDMAKISDAPPDQNGIEEFCTDPKFKHYCENQHIRVIYQHETDALGPAVARYYASKLWAGETYFMQMDAHLEFAPHWDTFYIQEVQAAKHYPKAVLSTYPPGFQNFGTYTGGTKGHKLCFCEFSTNGVERHIIRINSNGAYRGDEDRPKQIAYIAAGFFFARSEFLMDVPFDPYLPWCFMGEEIALSLRAWTAGWNIYAPRKNMIAHQYRPGRLGLPKFWEAVGRDSHRPQLNTRLQAHVLRRVKYLVGYPDDTRQKIEEEGDILALTEFEHYGLGKVRTREEYLNLTQIDPVTMKCGYIEWCVKGTMD